MVVKGKYKRETWVQSISQIVSLIRDFVYFIYNISGGNAIDL